MRPRSPSSGSQRCRAGAALRNKARAYPSRRRASRRDPCTWALRPAGGHVPQGRMVTSKVGESIARARERCSLLIDVVAPYYPRDVPSTRQYDDWPVTGPAFIARCTRWLQSMLELSDGHESAAAVLARIYPRACDNLRLKLDPETSVEQWVRKALDEAIKADNDMTRFGRSVLFTTERRAEYIAKRDSIPLKWPGVAGMAYKAGKY